MKKVFALLTLFITVLTTSVFAKPAIDITTIYMTDAEFSTILKDTFGWNEAPWLYFQVPVDPKGNDVLSTSSWTDPFSNVYQVSETEAGVVEIWHSLAQWDSVKTAGVWNVDTSYSVKNDSGSGSTTFTVLGYAPEPISSTLFIAGGATLIFRRFWKKRRMA